MYNDNDVPNKFEDVESEMPNRIVSFETAEGWAKYVTQTVLENDRLKIEIKRLKRKLWIWRIGYAILFIVWLLNLFIKI